jgi:hypothetical protein
MKFLGRSSEKNFEIVATRSGISEAGEHEWQRGLARGEPGLAHRNVIETIAPDNTLVIL